MSKKASIITIGGTLLAVVRESRKECSLYRAQGWLIDNRWIHAGAMWTFGGDVNGRTTHTHGNLLITDVEVV